MMENWWSSQIHRKLRLLHKLRVCCHGNSVCERHLVLFKNLSLSLTPLQTRRFTSSSIQVLSGTFMDLLWVMISWLVLLSGSWWAGWNSSPEGEESNSGFLEEQVMFTDRVTMVTDWAQATPIYEQDLTRSSLWVISLLFSLMSGWTRSEFKVLRGTGFIFKETLWNVRVTWLSCRTGIKDPSFLSQVLWRSSLFGCVECLTRRTTPSTSTGNSQVRTSSER